MTSDQTLSRRGFLGAAAGAAAATTLGPWASSAVGEGGMPLPKHKIGFQLYAIRTMLAQDTVGTLNLLGAIGYEEIEPAFTYGTLTPAQFRDAADAAGLRVFASHLNPPDFRGDNLQRTLDNAEILGQDWIGVSSFASPSPANQTVDAYKRFADEMNQFGAATAARGIRWYAHLHDYEWRTDPQTGKVLFEVWLEETDPSLVWFELDLFWAVLAQADITGYLYGNEDRFPLFHVKDKARGSNEDADLGEGEIDFKAMFEGLKFPQNHHYVAERDSQPDPPRTARVYYEWLTTVRLSRSNAAAAGAR